MGHAHCDGCGGEGEGGFDLERFGLVNRALGEKQRDMRVAGGMMISKRQFSLKRKNYPRTYSPNGETLFMCAFTCVFFLAVNAIALLVPPALYSLHQTGVNLFGMIALIVGSIVVPYFIIIKSIGYKVTLLPDAIEVTTLHGTRLISRADIHSYSYYISQYDRGVDLLSGKQREILYDFPGIYPQETLIRISISSFDRDQEFDDWVTSLPCISGGMPLPKNKNKKHRGRA
jgi:hypothetical protein